MADPNYTVYIALGIAAVAAVLMWMLSRGAKATPTDTASAGPAPGPGPHDRLLLRFVLDEAGERKGETVAVEGDAVIIKQADAFFQVEAARLEEAGGALRLAPGVDWEAARTAGEAWRQKSHKVIEYSPEELPKDEP